MAKLNKQEDLQAAVHIDGKSIISNDNSVIFEEITDDSMLLYIKTKDEKTNIKIKITKKK